MGLILFQQSAEGLEPQQSGSDPGLNGRLLPISVALVGGVLLFLVLVCYCNVHRDVVEMPFGMLTGKSYYTCIQSNHMQTIHKVKQSAECSVTAAENGQK